MLSPQICAITPRLHHAQLCPHWVYAHVTYMAKIFDFETMWLSKKKFIFFEDLDKCLRYLDGSEACWHVSISKLLYELK